MNREQYKSILNLLVNSNELYIYIKCMITHLIVIKLTHQLIVYLFDLCLTTSIE